MPSPKPDETPEQREARLRRQRAYEARKREADLDGFKARAAAAVARYRERHGEEARAATRKWHKENKPRINVRRRAWRAENVVRSLYSEAKARAKARGVEFTIALADIPPMGERCPLLGHRFAEREHGKRSPHTPSLDRIDPARGYVPGNVWIVGYRANLIKNDGTAAEHEAIARAMRAALGG